MPPSLNKGPAAKLRGALLAIGLSFAASQSAHAQAQSCQLNILSEPIYWNLERLSAVKSSVQDEGSPHQAAYARLIKDADKALSQTPYSVTHKSKAGPSGDVKDYVSLSRYFWPNPNTKDGLPYIRKDGRSNPELNGEDFDRRRSQHMTNSVRSLALAAYFTGETKYADKAQQMVRSWFLDEATAMNPHLKYAQSVPGATPGREFGILDGRIYWDVIDGMLLLQSARMTDAKFINELRGWFGEYAKWLVTSEFGQKAKSKKNNHGVYYDAQLSHILLFAGRCDLAKKIIKSAHGRTKTQIDKTGLMPEEKKRTQSLFYHAFNLRAFLRLAYFAKRLDMDIYDKRKGKGGTIKTSIDFVASYAGRVDEWPYEEINKNIDRALWRMFKNAQLIDESESLSTAVSALSYDSSEEIETLILGR